MELDRDSLVGEWSKISGEWSKFENDEHEYFIISDAVFSALCILGEEVEPCFEGANITKKGGIMYSLDRDEFKEKMLDFMADLKDALNNLECEGGKQVENLNNPTIETPVVETPEGETITEPVAEEAVVEGVVETPESIEGAEAAEGEESSEGVEEDFAKKKEEDEANEEDSNSEDKKESNSEEEDDKEKKKNYSLEEVVEYQELLTKYAELEGQFNAITEELNSIKPEYNKLKEKAIEAEEKAKEDMINSFYMLSEEDKAEVRANKANFSLEDIEAKLSVICVRKKVNFDLEDSSKNEDNTETPITTFNVGDSHDATPAWLRAVDAVAKNRK